jgi:NADP-dependent 3-hydroxy acid dehydrogenase YdfG
MSLSDYKVALVTGASSGVGVECVRALCNEGIEVVALARRADRLQKLANQTGCEPLVMDLTNTDIIYEKLAGRQFDILINNAGLGRDHEGFFSSTASEIDEMIDLNVGAAIHVVHAVASGMIERGYGHVVQIGSITGLYPLGMPGYSATKGAIHSFSKNLRMEFKGTRVRQTEICPGRIQTEFFDSAFKALEQKEQFLSGFTPLIPENIAEAVMYALGTPWSVNVSMIELTPTEQIPGGVSIQKAKEA